MKYTVIILGIVAFVFSCFSPVTRKNSSETTNLKSANHSLGCDFNLDSLNMEKITKTEKEWKEQLSDHEYFVTRQKGTERSWTGEYNEFKGHGVFTCKCCGLPLFHSDTKFNSGTGWPSFSDKIKPETVNSIVDKSHGMVRTEVTCARCDAHLGHVFPDGPQPTGQRYCINSVSLDFCEDEE